MEASESGKDGRGAGDWLPGRLERGVHLAVLWAFAVAQPVFDVIPQKAEFFIGREVGGWSLALFAVLFALLPPLLLLGLELAVERFAPRALTFTHLAFVFLLAAPGVLYPLYRERPERAWSLVIAALVLGALAVVLYMKARPARAILTVLAPMPLVFLGLFLFVSPAAKAVLPGGEPGAVDAPPSRTPVVMVVLDELPVTSLLDADGQIDRGRFPGFAALAGDATWYRNTVASSDFTIRAVPALLSGLRPRSGETPLARDHPGSLFTLLGKSHRVQADEYATRMCPKDICKPRKSELSRSLSLPTAFAAAYAKLVVPREIARTPPVGMTWKELNDIQDPTLDVDPKEMPKIELAKYGGMEFDRFIQTIEPYGGRGRAPFHFLHSSLPHTPWKTLPSGQLYTGEFQGRATGTGSGGRWLRQPGVAELAWQRHMLQAANADRLLAKLVDRLKRAGLYDRSLVVVVADHGANFEPGGSPRALERDNAADVGFVPFFVKRPGQRRGRVDERQLQTVDVLPTVADLLGRRVPWRTDGRPASALAGEGRRRVSIGLGEEDDRLLFDPAALRRQRERTLARQSRLFADGLYRVGPRRDLIGDRVGRLGEPAPDGPRMELDVKEDYADVNLRARYVPAFVTGTLPGTDRALVVAIAVNGRIAATARTYAPDGVTRLGAVIPPTSLRNGRNEIDVLAVEGRGARTRLRPLGGT